MKITYQNPGFQHSLDSLLLFLTGEETPFWTGPIRHFYPEVDIDALFKMNEADKKKYVEDVFFGVYQKLKDELDRKADMYNAHFTVHQKQIESALSDAFQVDAGALYNDLKGNVTLNPISPRFLQERYFDLFHMNSERGALGISLHEVIHYFWFHVWHEHFGDDYSEYETPSLKWILSEMVVEPIMRDERLRSLNPYFPKENGGCIYPYFRDMKADGALVLEELEKMYCASGITDFMEASYAYCMKHEKAIRRHMEAAENAF